MLSVLLNLFRLALWLRILSFLINVLFVLKKNVYSVAVGWSLIQKSRYQVGW